MMMTEVVTISGVHGSGKTTVLNAVANRLRDVGKNVWVINEFPYVPNIKIGTMDFQAWYSGVMKQREKVVDSVRKLGIFDIILLDRHPLDVDVYTQRLHHPDVKVIDIPAAIQNMHLFNFSSGNFQFQKMYLRCFVLVRETDDIIESIQERRKNETHRKEWNEEEREYIEEIQNWFKLFRSNEKVKLIKNDDLNETIDIVFEEIVESMHV